MNPSASGYLDQMAANDRRFGALYRDVAKAFGLSECAMWALYYIHLTEDTISQQDLVELMSVPKQTMNSAVSGLASKGLVELEPLPDARNRKSLRLTEAGVELAEQTVARLRAAEEGAVRVLGNKKARLYVELHNEFLTALNGELSKEGIRDAE